MKIARHVLTVFAILVITRCASASGSGVHLRHGATDVRFLGAQDDLSGCREIGTVMVRDGCMGSGAGSPREGSLDRVLDRLRNRVVRSGGNAVHVDRQTTHLAIDQAEAGSIESIEATIYNCLTP
jgi:hypothetical protein